MWLRNLSDFFVGSLRNARHFDREAYVKQLAEQGFTHVAVNGLGVEQPFESGPPGDMYSWFYDYSPDLDQFVSSKLIEGFYPKEYLKANLAFLKSNAALALKHGLVPGLHINSPRSMPEEFWKRYPFLRGARIDHPRESFQPRYTLAMAHPVAQEHYRELVRTIMSEAPQLGFIHIWTNDSGSGFEFVTSLYAGRNGGPYLMREWKSDEEIARKASENVLTYYRLLSGEAKRVNPDFRVICDLGSFYAERKYIAPKLGNGVDAGAFGSFEGTESEAERDQLKSAGAWIHNKIDLCNNNVLGLPVPRLTYEQLHAAAASGCKWILANITPRSLAPYDINSEVLRAFQCEPQKTIDVILKEAAERWVGARYASDLAHCWSLVDTAVRSYPTGIPYSTFAFPWFRLWVRPFVPNIDAIPENERRYYEDYLLATFNNPARVDLNNDMMWNFLTVKEAEEKKRLIDRDVLQRLDEAIKKASSLLGGLSGPEKIVFQDLRERLIAARCFYTTMRNFVAWIEAVHGYIETQTETQKQKYRAKTKDMILGELQNARNLLHLWEHSSIDWMPVSAPEPLAQKKESLHCYGENFGELLKNKIRLMEQHADDEPYIDPNYMWRVSL